MCRTHAWVLGGEKFARVLLRCIAELRANQRVGAQVGGVAEKFRSAFRTRDLCDERGRLLQAAVRARLAPPDAAKMAEQRFSMASVADEATVQFTGVSAAERAAVKPSRSLSRQTTRSFKEMSSFMKRGGAGTGDINLEIKQMRKTIKRYKSCIINPRTAKWIQYWDAASFVCLLFTATVTPVEVTLLKSIALRDLPDNPRHLTLFGLNRFVDLFFSIDMIFNFFMACAPLRRAAVRRCRSRQTPRSMPRADQEPAFRGGMWVTARHKIIKNYLRTWFVIDLLSVIPIDILTRLQVAALSLGREPACRSRSAAACTRLSVSSRAAGE